MPEEIYPSFKEFYEFFLEYPKGNPQKTYTELRFHIASHMTIEQRDVTWDLIKTKYREYLSKVRSEEQEDRFIKSLYSFIRDKDYNNIFAVASRLGFLDKWLKGE